MKESELEKFVAEVAEFIAQNAMNDYKRRADSAAKERRFACMEGEMRGDSYIVIAKKLIEIDKKHGII